MSSGKIIMSEVNKMINALIKNNNETLNGITEDETLKAELIAFLEKVRSKINKNETNTDQTQIDQIIKNTFAEYEPGALQKLFELIINCFYSYGYTENTAEKASVTAYKTWAEKGKVKYSQAAMTM